MGPKYDVAIVGGGIFGSVIAAALRQYHDMNVIVLDDAHIYRGSDPAACLMKPSWYSALGEGIHKPAMEMLRSLYDVKDIEFTAGVKMLKTTVHWINPKAILRNETNPPTMVQSITKRDGYYELKTSNRISSTVTAQRVIVAAGVWTNELMRLNMPPIQNILPLPEVVAQAGVSFIFKGQIAQPKISPWAPYRQLVAFNINDYEIWVGDGTTKKGEMLGPEKIQECLRRCAKFVDRDPEDETLEILKGFRPYVKDAKPCYLREHHPGLWVVTGGAKNGTLAAGWAAHQLVERIV